MSKILLAFSLILSDQAAKIFVLKKLHQNESIAVIKDVFHITLVYNNGSAFGFFSGQNQLLSIISFISILIIGFFLIKQPEFGKTRDARVWRGALMLILSGAAGNLIDRVRLGYVVDFLDFRIWPVFNFADSMITCGVFLLMYILLKKGEAN